MRNVLMAALILASTILVATATHQDAEARRIRHLSESAKEVITLSSANTLSFNQVVTPDSVAAFEVQLMEMSLRLPVSSPIIVVMNTPGGDVKSGMELIDFMKAIPQKIKTLTIFSASMGFHMGQNGDERLILPSSTLMSHRAKGGMEGEWDGSIKIRYDWIYKKLDILNQAAADRMHISLPVYKDLIKDEYWVTGAEAVSQGAADKVVYAKCDASFAGSETKAIDTMFGKINLIFAKCPLITQPLGIAANKHDKEGDKAVSFFTLLYSNPRQFVADYIINNKFMEYVK